MAPQTYNDSRTEQKRLAELRVLLFELNQDLVESGSSRFTPLKIGQIAGDAYEVVGDLARRLGIES